MNMVSESDLPRPVSGPTQNAPAGPGAAGRADPEERWEWRKHTEQLHDSFSRPGSGRKCRSGGEVGVAAEGQHIQGNIFICGLD